MNFGFEQEQTNALLLAEITHLRDAANKLQIDTDFTFGVDESMEVEQLQTVEQSLRQAIADALKQAEELRKELAAAQALEQWYASPPCFIGPYDGKVCTICGLRDPSNVEKP